MGQVDFTKNKRQGLALHLMLDHKYSLLYGGGRSGKTFVILYMIIHRALKKKSRHAVLRFHFTDVKKSVIMETLPELCEIMELDYHLNKQDWYVKFPNGSEIWFGGLDEGRGIDRVLGKEYSSIWLNEASEIGYDAFNTIKTRLAQKSGLKNRMFFDLNPTTKASWTYKVFFKHIEPTDNTLLKNPEYYGHLQMNPTDNLDNISEDYIETLETMSKDKRQRFLDGNFAEVKKGAKFTEAVINRFRVLTHPELKEVVVAVDPSVSNNVNSDEIGIFVVGKGFDGRGYMLEDGSGLFSPKEWAQKVCKLYAKWDCSWVIFESNQGGNLVEHTIQVYDEHIPCKGVHAKKGKLTRADPISALYENGKFSHVGVFQDLEEEMTTYTGKASDDSPNRMDAAIYGALHLFPSGVYSDSEIFNRDALKYFSDYDFTNSHDFIYIKITGANSKGANYNFLALYAKLKDGKIFITDCIFNSMLPSDNLEQLQSKFVGAKHIFVECSPAFVAFAKDVKCMKIPVRTVKEFTKEENLVISESGFIKEHFVFEKDSGSTYYKSYMQQLNSYVTTAEANESTAANILPSVSYVVKRLMKKYLK